MSIISSLVMFFLIYDPNLVMDYLKDFFSNLSYTKTPMFFFNM